METKSRVTPEQEERAFLHEIATPLSTAMLMIEMYFESMKEKSAPPEECKQVKIVMTSLEKMKELLKGRREILINRGNVSS